MVELVIVRSRHRGRRTAARSAIADDEEGKDGANLRRVELWVHMYACLRCVCTQKYVA